MVKHHVHNKQYLIPSTLPLLPVSSAFGGLGLYRTESLRGLRYDAFDKNRNLTCEHVSLHYQMLKRGAKLFIDPALLNDAPPEHLGRSQRELIPQDLLKELY